MLHDDDHIAAVKAFPKNKGVILLIDLSCNLKIFSYLFIEIKIFKKLNKIFEIYLFTTYTLVYFHMSHYTMHRIFKGKIPLREKLIHRNWSTFLSLNLLYDTHSLLSNLHKEGRKQYSPIEKFEKNLKVTIKVGQGLGKHKPWKVVS